MRLELTIEALIGPGEEVLAEVVHVLRPMPLPPESFVWSAIPETGEARVWMIISADEARLRELVAGLGKIPAVRRIIAEGPGQAIMEKLAGPLATP